MACLKIKNFALYFELGEFALGQKIAKNGQSVSFFQNVYNHNLINFILDKDKKYFLSCFSCETTCTILP